MVGITATSAPETINALGELVLRVCGTSRDGQTIRLRSAKCTIGSGPRCTLRLRARGVAPLHCLILRGPDRTVIRCWSPGTRLNGQLFTDAELTPGDHLGVGPIELEVLESSRPPATTPGSACPAEHDRVPSREAFDRRELDSAEADLRKEQQALAEQSRQLRQSMAEWHVERAESENRLAERAEQIGSLKTELETQRESLETHHRQWQAERAESENRLIERIRQIESLTAELETRRQSLETDRRQWQAERAELENRSTERTEELDTRWAELETHRATLETDRHQWQAERAESGNRLTERAEEIESLKAELVAQRQTLETDRRQLRAERAEQDLPFKRRASDADESPSDNPKPSQATPPENARQQTPINLADVFGRMGIAKLLDDDETTQKPDDLPPRAAPAQGSDTGQASQGPVRAGDEEESIDDYMTQLLQRVRASATSASAVATAPPRAVEPVRAPQPEEKDLVSSATSKRREPAQMLPRAAARESLGDLSAMRAVANVSAQSALNRHSRRQMGLSTRVKLILTLLSLFVSGLLLARWWMAGGNTIMFYSALTCFVVALFWGIQFAVLTGRMIVNKSGNLDWPSAPTRRDRPKPIVADATTEPATSGSDSTNSPDAAPRPADESAADEHR